MANLTLDRNEFVDWLRGMPPSAAVGQSMSSASCPLASYLYSRGLREVLVGWQDFISFTACETLPPWASAFVVTLDAAYPTRVPVPAAHCLRILSEPMAEDLAVAEAEALAERGLVPA